MEEKDLARAVMEAPRAEPIYYLVNDADGSLRIVDRPMEGLRASGTEGALMRLAARWGDVLRMVRFMVRWSGRLDASLPPIFEAMANPPDHVSVATIDAAAADLATVFDGVVRSMPGTMAEKFNAMGAPPLLAFMCGMRDRQLSNDEYAQAVTAELMGRPVEQSTDGRVKTILEPATGRTWPSVSHLAAELGCAIGTLYNHMRGNPSQPTVYGRSFTYAPPAAPDPRLPAFWSEEQKEAARQRARDAGFEATF